MIPRLVAVAGPLAGKMFPLIEGKETDVGRDSSNEIALTDSSVSRKHCQFRKVGEQWVILDLDSLNGTFVNRVPLKERILTSGDRIEIGDSIFIFTTEEDSDADEDFTERDQGKFENRSTILLRGLKEPYVPDRTNSDILQLLLKVSNSIHSIQTPRKLLERLLELVIEAVPAESGAIVVLQGEDVRSLVAQPSRPAASSTVVRQVLQEETAVICNDVSASPDFQKAKSLISSGVRSVLCVPLPDFGEGPAAIYLTSQQEFAEAHLQLVTAIAGIGSIALRNASHLEWLKQEKLRIEEEVQLEHNMVGESQTMRQLYQVISRVAPADSTVLIEGESGTGKELIARAIHQNSSRAERPFVAINCAALTESLLESELFGHEKGAFTGAVSLKKGKIEIAHSGTLFLDEIGELALPLQTKLLRVLQEREFERVGGLRPIPVDVRVIAATNKNLKDAVSDHKFRQDLYYRLNVVTMVVPPLRERAEDIPLLAAYFAGRYGDKFKRKIKGISPEARQLLLHHDWPGNIRELQNAIERAVVLGTSDVIRPEDLPESLWEKDLPAAGAQVGQFHEAVLQTKKQIILQAFQQAGGNYTEAAKLLGLHPNYLHRLIRNLNLKSLLK